MVNLGGYLYPLLLDMFLNILLDNVAQETIVMELMKIIKTFLNKKKTFENIFLHAGLNILGKKLN